MVRSFAAMNLSTPLGRFRLVAILEGISYLLFGITMPLKYVMDIPEPNYIVGMAHGLLFMVYIAMCLQIMYLYKLNIKDSFFALIASLIPVGTFIVDAKILKPMSEKEDARNNI